MRSWVRVAWFFVGIVGSVRIAGVLGVVSGGEVGNPDSGELIPPWLEKAREHQRAGDPFSAGQLAEEGVARGGLSTAMRREALGMVARSYALYGQPAAWRKVREACEAILEGQVGLVGGERWEAGSLAIEAYRALWATAEWEVGLRALRAWPGVVVREQVRLGLELARLLQQSDRAQEALGVLEALEAPLGALREGWEGILLSGPEWRAEASLVRGRCLADLGREVEARLEVREIGPGRGGPRARAVEREARLFRMQRGWEVPQRRVLKVLFVGSSHTLMGEVPGWVDRLSASAGRWTPLVVSGEVARMGTGMRLHWMAGEGPETARRRIRREPWDVVVVEAFYRNSRVELLDYGSRYRDLAREVGARLVIYGTPAARELEYPAGFTGVHSNHVWLGGALKCGVAPGVRALMRLLGAHPERRALEGLYKDWIHSTTEGAYLSACTLYSALTCHSPEGLEAPSERLSPDQAALFQRAAWDAFGETQQRIEEGAGFVPESDWRGRDSARR